MAFPSWPGLAAAGVAAGILGGLTVAAAAFGPVLWPDAVEYIAIANAWTHGAGFVDPVKWTYYLESGVPLPATAWRSPVPAALLSIPFALGMTVASVRAFHALLASLVIGALVLFAQRMMRWQLALACGLMVGLSLSWLTISMNPMSDLIAIGALLLVLATAGPIASSVPMAVVCGAATLLGWATRPAIVLLVVPIVVNAIWSIGLRAAVKSRALAVYLLTTVAGYAVLHVASVALTGIAPYAGYGFMSEMLSALEPLLYAKKYVGSYQFISTRLPWIAKIVVVRVGDLWSALFVTGRFAYVGWIAVVGVVYCLVRRHEDSARTSLRRLVALCCLLFVAQTVLTYAAFDGYRYPLPIAVCGALCGFAWLDDMLVALARVLGLVPSGVPAPSASSMLRRLAAGALLALPLLLTLRVHHGITAFLPTMARNWSRYLAGDLPPAEQEPGTASIRDLCRQTRPGAVVAAHDPWALHAWCGNPTIMLPVDLDGHPELQSTFLRKEGPVYIVGDPPKRDAWLAASRELRRIGGNEQHSLYEVLGAGSRPVTWQQPPPFMCAGRDPSCRRAVGR